MRGLFAVAQRVEEEREEGRCDLLIYQRVVAPGDR